MGVRFNSKAAMAELRLRLIDAVRLLQQEFLDETRGNMHPGANTDSWYAGDVVAIGNMIYAEVIGGADAAMDAFGKGSKMAGPSDNPGLLDYMEGPLWNDDRHDTHVRSRARGTYVDIYGVERTSNSNIGGIDLEQRKRRDGSMPWAPIEPSWAPQTAARWMENGRVQEVIAGVVETMPWGNYFEETKEG